MSAHNRGELFFKILVKHDRFILTSNKHMSIKTENKEIKKFIFLKKERERIKLKLFNVHDKK